MPDTICCPNCDCQATPNRECDECGFRLEAYPSKVEAVDRFRRYNRRPDTIVTKPSPEGGRWWIVGVTSLALI